MRNSTAGTCLTLALLAAQIGRSTPAHACSPGCSPEVLVPKQDWMPGSSVAFAVTAAEPHALSLKTAAGDPIPAHVVTRGKDRLFVPDSPIAPGTALVLEYTLCPTFVPPLLGKYAFTADLDGPVELRAAALGVYERGVSYPGQHSEQTFVRVGYDPPDAQGTLLHLMQHSATIDGHPISVRDSNGSLSIQLITHCGPDSPPGDGFYSNCGSDPLVPVGRHTLQVQTHILGASSDPEPAQLEIETACPDASGALTVVPAEAGTALGTTDLSNAEVELPSEPGASSVSGAGCALSTTAHPYAAAWALTLLPALSLLKRRAARR